MTVNMTSPNMNTANNNNNVAFNAQMPLYIPRVFPEHANEGYIQQIFHTHDIGHVSRVDFIEKHQDDGKSFFEAFVHFDHWYPTPQAYELQKLIANPAIVAKVVHESLHYRTPSFWIVNECLNPETPRERDMKQTIRQLEDVMEYEQHVAQDHADKQANLIANLLELVELQQAELAMLRERHNEAETYGALPDDETIVDGMPVDDFDLHRNIPESQDELPVTAMEFAREYPVKHPLHNFYSEVGDALSSDWLQKSDEEKTAELNAELEQLASRTAETVLSPAMSPCSSSSPLSMDNIQGRWSSPVGSCSPPSMCSSPEWTRCSARMQMSPARCSSPRKKSQSVYSSMWNGCSKFAVVDCKNCGQSNYYDSLEHAHNTYCASCETMIEV